MSSFEVWGRTIKKGKTISEYTACIDDDTMSRTKKVYKALEMICYELDLSVPMWFPVNQRDFIKYSRARFRKDNFIEEIDFDYLDFQITKEDW
jgi:hypothetical protein